MLALDGRPIHSRSIAGRGPVLVFLHEALGSVRHWKDFPDALCGKTGRPGFVYDRLGHGESGPFAARRGRDYLAVEARALARVLDAAKITDPVILVGHSDGGTIALLFAAAFPARTLGVVSEAAHVFNDESTRVGVRATLEEAKTGPLLSLLERHHGEKTDAVFRAWHETWLSPFFKDWDIRSELGKIQAPVLVIQGSEDRYGTLEQAEAMAAGVKRGESLILQGCGHTPHRERREETLARMAAFIARLA